MFNACNLRAGEKETREDLLGFLQATIFLRLWTHFFVAYGNHLHAISVVVERRKRIFSFIFPSQPVFLPQTRILIEEIYEKRNFGSLCASLRSVFIYSILKFIQP